MGSNDRLFEEIEHLKDLKQNHIQEKAKYKKAYDILMDYFDFIPEDERQEVSDKLDKVGL